MRYPQANPPPNMDDATTTLPTRNQRPTLAELAAEYGDMQDQRRCSTPNQNHDPTTFVPVTPPHDTDNEILAQSPNAATKHRQQSQDESSASGKKSIDLLAEEEQEWRERTMLFFVPAIIAMEDIKRLISVHVDPTSWMHRGLEMCSYKENDGYLHERVIRLTNIHDVIRQLKIQFVDVNTVMGHSFATTSVDPDDPGITP